MFAIKDLDTNDGIGRLTIASNGQTTISGNCDFNNGIDVTGDATFEGHVNIAEHKQLDFAGGDFYIKNNGSDN